MDCIDPIDYIEKTLAELQNGMCYGRVTDSLNGNGEWLTRNGDAEDKELNFYLNLPSELDPVGPRRAILGRKKRENSCDTSQCHDMSLSDHSDVDSFCCSERQSSCDHSDVWPGMADSRRPSMSISSCHSPPHSPTVLASMDICSENLRNSVQDLASVPTSPTSLHSTGFFNFFESSTEQSVSASPFLSNHSEMTSHAPLLKTLSLDHGSSDNVFSNGACDHRSSDNIVRNGACEGNSYINNNFTGFSISRSSSSSSLIAQRVVTQETSSVLGQEDRGDQRGMFCVFCKKNRETREFYSTHILKDSRGNVICPILRKYVCPSCGATGNRAHTVRHCPENGQASSMSQ